ncbi:hypothetical protein SAMN02745121_03458 [Nannocystis exedens]|uniref:Secreted protein n=1 Tax=Nannocystis exedens TaxID=54 RepID=A0A1I1YRP6_9BACT|nr:hypothetical protein [Nannocystis exedens]PCC70221.1 hypothetical protein NAEX_03254 [Nannocystis exedens]SFE21708.1 hypothetical protein SAMN02745121_03458 [Nannocystis exedens]
MSIIHAFMHPIQAACFGLFAASAGPEAAFAEPEAQGSAAEAVRDQVWHGCSYPSESGRKYAEVRISPQDPTMCLRMRFDEPAWPDSPSCYRVAMDLGCVDMVTLN